jgi:DNA-binding CsgD family transcriptional regulator
MNAFLDVAAVADTTSRAHSTFEGSGRIVAVRHISAAQRAALSGRDLRAALEFVHTVSAVEDVDAFADATMRGLAELVRCDYVSYVETNPGSGRAMAMTEPREAMFADAPAALARNLDGHPLVRYYSATGEIRALKMSDFLTDRQFRSSRLYDELFKPAETYYLLSAVLPMPAGLVVGFSLHRRTRDFTERDRALLDLLEPHLVQAYERSLLRAAVGALDEAATNGEPGLLVLGRDGAWLWASTGVEATLARHFGRSPRGALPRAIEAWLAAECATPLVTVYDGRRLRIDSLGARPAALLLTEHATRPSHEALARLGLSRRQAEVLGLLACGQTNSEIARRLSVTPGTVKRHLEGIYSKLGVHTRAAAVAAAWEQADARPGNAADGL